MAKINREEYKVLKGLDEVWKWIARESDGDYGGDLFAYSEEPFKKRDIGRWNYGGWFHSIDNHLFQFIQWENENPFSIAELIEEYEK